MLQQLLDIPTVLVFGTIFCVVYAYRKAIRPNNFPVGPPGKSFIGNVSLIHKNKKLVKTFADLRKTYGKIYSLQLGWYPAIVISDYDLLKEALVEQSHKFSNRPNHIFIVRWLVGNQGLLNGHGEVWKVAKRLSLRTMRDLGVGKSTVEEKVTDQISDIIYEIGKQRGEPFRFGSLFAKASCNIICSLLFNRRYDFKDREFVKLVDDLDSLFKEGGLQSSGCLYIPYLFPMLFIGRGSLDGIQHFYGIENYVKKQIEKHRTTFNGNNIRDFVDLYIEAEKEQSGHKAYTTKNVFTTIVDLFFAGTETTGTSMLWGMLFMLKYPAVQDKCRQEIMEIVGNDRNICMKDHIKMPYVEATICEILRIGNIAPYAVMHCTDGPVDFHGYSLPDKTIVIPDMYHIHMNPEYWKDPEIFNPGRFLNDEGHVIKPQHFIPFSLGKRACPGESLAKTELFLYFTTLLQKFKFSSMDVSKLPGPGEGDLGVTLTPPSYEIIADPTW